MNISIVIPAFNEANQISAHLEELENYMASYIGSSGWEIIVVNDGSTDNTLEILNNLKQKKEWLKVINLNYHQGRGIALRAGLEATSYDIVVTFEADLNYSPFLRIK